MKKDLVIVGGGITGLVSALIASENNFNVIVAEKSKKLGGLLNTFKFNGASLEYYYHHYFKHDVELIWLLKNLKIEKKLYFKKSTMGIFSNNFLYNFNNISDLLKYNPLNFISKIRFLLTTFYLGKFTNHFHYENISAVHWLTKWAGEDVTNNIWSPLLRVKFGKNYNKIPLTWLIGRIKQRFYSRKNGDETLGYINGSTQLILDKIIEKLKKKGVKFIKNAKIGSVSDKQNLILKINNKIYKNKNIIFTCQNEGIIEIIGNKKPKFTRKLRKIKYLGAICVVLKLKRNFSNIYWLNIADQSAPFGGIIEHTNFVDKKHYKNDHVLYLSKYFDNKDYLYKRSKKEIFQIAKRFLKRVDPNFNEKLIKNFYIFSSTHAAVLNDLNFSKKIVKYDEGFKNVFIANMMHIYPEERSINNSVRVAANVCKKIGIKNEIPKGISNSGIVGI